MRFLFKFSMMVFFCSLYLSSCSAEENVPTEAAKADVDDLSEDNLVSQGTFSGDNGYNVSGVAELYFNPETEINSLVFKNFQSDNGINVDVYLAQDSAATNFTNCLLYTSPSPRDQRGSRMPSSA